MPMVIILTMPLSMRRAIIGVRLDAAGEDETIGLGSVLIHVDRHPVVRLAELHDFHGRADRAAHVALGDAVAFENTALTFDSAAAMAAHGGEDEGLRAQRLELGNDLFGALGDVGNAAAAYAHGDGHARLHLAAHFGPFELLGHRVTDVGDFRRCELLTHVHHAR